MVESRVSVIRTFFLDQFIKFSVCIKYHVQGIMLLVADIVSKRLVFLIFNYLTIRSDSCKLEIFL